MYADPLLDKAFLKRLDEVNERTIYAKVIALSWDEAPIAEIQGMVTGGTINIDGSSRVRRTCNLTLVANTVDIQNIDWTLRTKIRVYIGLDNTVSNEYEPIIWFPQGTFILTSFSNTYNNSGYTITLQGRDKMCLLNGDLGGNLFASHDFGKTYIFDNDGNYRKEDIPIKTIIKEAVHTYAQEPYDNIFINDLDTCGVELIEWRGDYPVFILQQEQSNGVLNWDLLPMDINPDLLTDARVDELANDGRGLEEYIYESCWRHRVEEPVRVSTFFPGIYHHDSQGNTTSETYIINRATYGEAIGYRATDLTYAGDLIIDVNGTIVQMLDKIVEMLGEFEYYYDTAGHFIFQRKKIYFNASWSNAVVNDAKQELYYDATATTSMYSYEFKDNYLLNSIQNKPELKSIKNDFGIWGKKTSASGETVDIHMRYAIDKKPTEYYSCKYRQAFHAENAYNPLNQMALRIRAAKAEQLLDQEASYESIYQYLNSKGWITTDYQTAIQDIANAVKADMTGYDWRQLIYFMAEDNMLSSTRIAALKKCLRTGYFQYDPNSISPLMYTQCYYYNALTDKFFRMDYITDNDGDVSPSVLGYNRLKTYLVNGNAIYGKDPSYSYYDFSDDEEVVLRHEAQQIVDEYNANILAIAQSYQNDYWDYMSAYWTQQTQMQNDYLWDETSAIYQRYSNNTERWDAYTAAWAIIEQQYIDYANTHPVYVLRDGQGNPVVYTYAGQDYEARYQAKLSELKTIDDILNDNPDTQGLLAAKAARLISKEIEQWQASFNTGYDAYYADILAFWPLMYKINQDHEYEYNADGTISFDTNGNPIEVQNMTYVLQESGAYQQIAKQKMTMAEFNKWRVNGYWNPDNFIYNFRTREVTISRPQELLFWLDFIDYRGDLLQYLPELIGRRAKAIKDDKIKAIYYRETPEMLFVDNTIDADEQVEYQDTLAYQQTNTNAWLNTYLYISSQGKSAKEELDNLLYQHSYYQDTITLQSIPIYYLEPNTRILVQDTKSGINGDYLIKSMSISLVHDGLMSITANRAGERVI